MSCQAGPLSAALAGGGFNLNQRKNMRTFNKLTAILVLLAVPVLLRADADVDRKIEAAAKDAYNYRTVLAGHVKVKASNGAVTLTGSVPDADQRTLAEDTVGNL